MHMHSSFDPKGMTKFFLEAIRFTWHADPVAESNGHRLYYAGTQDEGRYIMIDRLGLASVGEYKNAYPQITDALFIPVMQVKFPSLEEADLQTLKVCGERFMRDILGLEGR